MTKEEFLVRVAEILDTEGVTPATRFRETDGWCSLQAFGLLVFLENECSTPVTIERFMTFETVADLMREASVSVG